MLTRTHRGLRAAAVAVLLAAGLAGCGDDSGTGDCAVRVSDDLSSKPTITVPDCDPPTQLRADDVVEGTGDAAEAGDAVAVQYVGVSWSGKQQFDASWDRGGQPFTVQPLGAASVIKGWNQGLIGAKVGGRRTLVIPPDLGYGAQGAGGVIGPNETLVFVVDIVSITPGS